MTVVCMQRSSTTNIIPTAGPVYRSGKTLACHHCDLGSNPGIGLLQGSGRPSNIDVFSLEIFRFSPSR